MKDGRIAYERGYGMADLDHKIKISPATIFNVGSIAKQFTGLAILMLSQEGKLSVDDSIRKYVPELPGFATQATIRQMLHHTSGLRDYEQLLHFDGWRLDSPDQLTNTDIFNILSRQRELNFEPGTDFSYSNTNFMLLAQVVESVSGMPFAKFEMTRLFEPLGMTDTHFRTAHGEVVKDLAYSYEDDDGVTRLALPNYDTYGATNLLTTARDLAKWEENFYSGRVAGIEVVRQLQEPGALNDGTRLNYAPGMFISLSGSKWAESGTAGDAGYRADVLRIPDDHFSTITLCNLGSINPTELNLRIAELYLKHPIGDANSDAEGPPSLIAQDREHLKKLAGVFTDAKENYLLKIDSTDDNLRVQLFTGPNAMGPASVKQVDSNRFRGLGMTFNFSADAQTLAVQRNGMPSIRLTRLPPYKPAADQLHEFDGEYISKELDIPYYISSRQEGLTLSALKLPPLPVVPMAPDLFIGGDRRILFTRDAHGRPSGMLMSGYWNRVENLRFERVTK